MRPLPALRIPGVPYLDPSGRRNDVMVARRADDPAAVQLANHPGHSGSPGAVGKSRLDVGERVLGFGNRGEVQLPELPVGGRGPKVNLVLPQERLQPDSPALQSCGWIDAKHGILL